MLSDERLAEIRARAYDARWDVNHLEMYHDRPGWAGRYADDIPDLLEALDAARAALERLEARRQDTSWLKRIVGAAIHDTMAAHGEPLTAEYVPSAAKRVAKQIAAQLRDDARAALGRHGGEGEQA